MKRPKSIYLLCFAYAMVVLFVLAAIIAGQKGFPGFRAFKSPLGSKLVFFVGQGNMDGDRSLFRVACSWIVARRKLGKECYGASDRLECCMDRQSFFENIHDIIGIRNVAPGSLILYFGLRDDAHICFFVRDCPSARGRKVLQDQPGKTALANKRGRFRLFCRNPHPIKQPAGREQLSFSSRKIQFAGMALAGPLV